MLKKILIVLTAILVLSTSSHAGWKWNTFKAGVAVGAVKTYKAYKKKHKYNPTRHSVEQKINRKVKSKDELEALKNPLKTKEVKIDSFGRKSQRYIGEKAEVAINPDSKKIVSVNPTSTRKALKLKKELQK